jgi:hypothetical protein
MRRVEHKFANTSPPLRPCLVDWVGRCSLYDEQMRVQYQEVGWRKTLECINEAEYIVVRAAEVEGLGPGGIHVVNIRTVEDIESVKSPVNDAIPCSSFQSKDVIKEGRFSYRSCYMMIIE